MWGGLAFRLGGCGSLSLGPRSWACGLRLTCLRRSCSNTWISVAFLSKTSEYSLLCSPVASPRTGQGKEDAPISHPVGKGA